MDWLSSLFALQGNPAVIQTYDFNVTDEQDRIRTSKVKVDSSVQYTIDAETDHWDGTWRKWRVVLFAPDPRLYSSTSTVISGTE
jgi:hypothetical protein